MTEKNVEDILAKQEGVAMNELPHTTTPQSSPSVLHRTRRAIEMGVVALEVTPANETLRYGVFVATLAATKDPILSAGAFGVATTAIEGVGATASASLLASPTGDKTTRWINNKIEDFGVSKDATVPPVAKAGVALLGGSAIVVGVKHREDPNRSFTDNFRYGVGSAVALGGVCAAQGYLMAEGITNPEPETIGGALIAIGGLVAFGKWARAKLEQKKLIPEATDSYIEEFDLRVRLTDDPRQIEEASALEQAIWDKNNFGSLDEYRKYDDQCRMFVAEEQGEIIGVTRMFYGGPELPPFMDLPFYDKAEKEQIEKSCLTGDIEELGTTGIDKEKDKAPKHVVALEMWRLAYRDAMQRGVKNWGIIMEPERVEKMNQNFGFKFKQLGPAKDYQGGDCAPFVMDLQEVDAHMSQTLPELYDWFVKQPLVKRPKDQK